MIGNQSDRKGDAVLQGNAAVRATVCFLGYRADFHPSETGFVKSLTVLCSADAYFRSALGDSVLMLTRATSCLGK